MKNNDAKLTEMEKIILKLRFFSEKSYTYEEIGISIGISRTWAKHHEDKALQKIKTCIEKNCCKKMMAI